MSGIAWAMGTLDYFGVAHAGLRAGRQILAANLAVGALSLSLGDVLAFALTV